MDNARKKISREVLDMKFMQKTKQRIKRSEQKKKDAELVKTYIGDDIATKEAGGIEIVRDISVLENLKFGRMSFKGFNPEVEKLMLYYERIRRGEDSDDDSEEGVDVDSEEMAQTLGRNASSALKKKFASKADRSEMINETKKINFDETSIRKRTAEKAWAEESNHKFLKPNEDV